VVSRPFESAVEAEITVRALRQANVFRLHEDVLVQPEEENIPPMSERMALRLLEQDAAWIEFRDGFAAGREIDVKTEEHARCWVFIATVPPAHIPPGEAFLVDKDSRRIFPRRYVDVVRTD